MSDPAGTLDTLLQQSQQHFHAWCIQHGIDYDQMDEDQVTDLIDQQD